MYFKFQIFQYLTLETYTNTTENLVIYWLTVFYKSFHGIFRYIIWLIILRNFSCMPISHSVQKKEICLRLKTLHPFSPKPSLLKIVQKHNKKVISFVNTSLTLTSLCRKFWHIFYAVTSLYFYLNSKRNLYAIINILYDTVLSTYFFLS
jgi:hypothetical protein